MKKQTLILLALPLFLTSCGNKNYGYSTGTNSATTNTGTTTGNTDINNDYMLLGEDGNYSFEVVNGHAYACYTPKCTSSFYFYGEGDLFEASFITGVSVHPLNNLSSNVKGNNSDISFNSYEEHYYVNIELSVLQTYVNKQVVIDFTIDQGHLADGSKFQLEFTKEEHNLNFNGECSCGNYRSDKIYNFNFSQPISISLTKFRDQAFLILDTPRDNFTLYFDTTMPTDDLSTAIDGFTEHGDYYIRNSVYMVIGYSDKKLEYNNPGAAIKYIAFTNSSYEDTPQNFTVSPR